MKLFPVISQIYLCSICVSIVLFFLFSMSWSSLQPWNLLMVSHLVWSATFLEIDQDCRVLLNIQAIWYSLLFLFFIYGWISHIIVTDLPQDLCFLLKHIPFTCIQFYHHKRVYLLLKTLKSSFLSKRFSSTLVK